MIEIGQTIKVRPGFLNQCTGQGVTQVENTFLKGVITHINEKHGWIRVVYPLGNLGVTIGETFKFDFERCVFL